MTPLQDLARGTFHDWLDLPPWPTADSIRQQTVLDAFPHGRQHLPATALDTFAAAFPDLMAAAMRTMTADELQQAADFYARAQELQQAADKYQREAIATAQSEAAHEAAIQEHSK